MQFRRLLLVLALALPVLADEGMWLFSQFPKDAFKEKHATQVTDAFLDHLRLSTVRIGSGSGAFVSARGLVLTNHHLVADCLVKAKALDDGFYAAAEAQESRCPGLEAQVLVGIENVTDKVKSAANGVAKPADAL